MCIFVSVILWTFLTISTLQKNEGERIFYSERYAVALSDMSKAGNLNKVSLDKAVRSQHLDRTNVFS